MKILCIGDPHIKLDNIKEFGIFIEKLLKTIKENHIKYVILLGDLLHYHDKIFTDCLNLSYKFIEKLREISKIFILVGNHDYINNSQFLTSNHWLNFLKNSDNVEIIDTVKIINIEQFNFIMCPYVYPGRFQEALNQIEYKENEISCIFCHQEFYGCKMGAIISEVGDKWDKPINIVSGHIHDNQTITCFNNFSIYYPGTPMQHAFGESSKKIVAILDFELSKMYNLREISLDLPTKKIVYLDTNQLNSKQLQASKDNEQIKYTISGTYEEFKDFKKSENYEKIIKNGDKVVFKHIFKKQTKYIETNFSKVFEKLVLEENDNILEQVYKYILTES